MSDEPTPRCPACEAPYGPEDRFCERCGAQLATAEQAGASGTPVAVDIDATVVRAPSAAEDQGCSACGAPEEAIGDDGYCTRCGILRRSPPEHHEIDVVVAAGITDQGHVHRRNEDALFLEASADGGVAAVVCDGISSSSVPHLAARSAAQAAGDTLADALRDGVALAAATASAATAAQRAVIDVASPPAAGRDVPACTLVSGVWRDDELVIGWVGDSRAYWICGPDSHQLTVDDSWATEQIGAGLLSAEQAEADPRAHSVTRWLGADAPEEPPQIATLQATVPGRLVLCSDGLWNYLSGAADVAQLVDALPAEAPAIDVARSLVDTALAAGGRDNVTVAVIDVQPPRRETT